MRRLTAIALLLLATCAKKPPPKAPPPPPDPKAELKERVAELYSSLVHQEPERLNALLTADVLAYGLGPKDTFTNRDTLVDAMRTELIPFGLRGDVFKVASSSPHVGLAAGELSGWFYDFPRFEQVRAEKASKLWKVRVTGHALKDDGRWRFDALHVSFAYPDDELYAADAAKKLRAPETAGAEKGPDSEQVIGLTKRMLDDLGVKVDRTSDSEDAVLIGTAPADVYEGGKAFKDFARPQLAAAKKGGFTMKIEDGPRARLAPDKKSGWVSGVVVLRIGKRVVPAFRALWVYAEEKEVWNLVSEHTSVGVPNELRKPSSGGDEPALDAGR